MLICIKYNIFEREKKECIMIDRELYLVFSVSFFAFFWVWLLHSFSFKFCCCYLFYQWKQKGNDPFIRIQSIPMLLFFRRPPIQCIKTSIASDNIVHTYILHSTNEIIFTYSKSYFFMLKKIMIFILMKCYSNGIKYLMCRLNSILVEFNGR